MGLPDVNIVILDGGLGLLPPSASGLHCKVGVASKGIIGQIVALSSADQVADAFGTGPLANALYDSFMAGAGVIYAVRADGDIPGTIGAVTATKTGQGNMTVSGSPLDAYDVIVEIIDPRMLNVATFRYSLDGGDTYSRKATVPSGGTYQIPETGITLTFTEYATAPDDSFKAGDKYTFKTTAPGASVSSINAAIDPLIGTNAAYELIHVVGDSTSSMWAALSARAAEAESKFRWIHFVAEARGPSATEDVDAWVNALVTEASGFASPRVSVVAARAEIADMKTGRIVDRNGAGIYVGRLMSGKVSQSPGKVMVGPLPGINRLNPYGINDGHITMLDEARYVTFRHYEGYGGTYVTNGRMMAEPGSDFTYVEARRTMDKACRLVRFAALRFMQAEATPSGLDDLEARLQEPLGIMKAEGEILSGRVVIPRDQNILAGAKLQAKVRIVPIPIMREIEVEIGFENPFARVA